MAIQRPLCTIGVAFLIAGFSVFVASERAIAQQPSEAQILEALKPKGGTRGLALSPEEQRRAEEDRRFIDELRSRQKVRSLTPRDRDTVAKIAADKPSVDIEVQFEYKSTVITKEGRQFLQSVGRVMSGEQLKGTVFFINGHTDAKGGTDYNQALSERRAEAVKRFLIAEFRLPADTLVAVGYGKSRLKNTTDPLAGENRRVQIVNTEQSATATAR
jgi:outer membrane protein OmpA-like peptidoglycan-associated protein